MQATVVAVVADRLRQPPRHRHRGAAEDCSADAFPQHARRHVPRRRRRNRPGAQLRVGGAPAARGSPSATSTRMATRTSSSAAPRVGLLRAQQRPRPLHGSSRFDVARGPAARSSSTTTTMGSSICWSRSRRQVRAVPRNLGPRWSDDRRCSRFADAASRLRRRRIGSLPAIWICDGDTGRRAAIRDRRS